MSAHDRHLAAYHSSSAELVCRNCGFEFAGQITTEYGQTWTEPEECPECGSPEVEARELSDYDIQERIYEARGEDF